MARAVECAGGGVRHNRVLPRQEIKKALESLESLFVFYPGSDLLSHAVSSAVSSALRGLTSVFGMGTGVSPAVWPPGNWVGRARLAFDGRVRAGGPGTTEREQWNEAAAAGTALRTRRSSHSAAGLLPGCEVPGKFYGQAERPISTGKLHALLRFHIPPIKEVVFLRPSYPDASGLGDLILGRASRLDAFSGYPFRTSLPSHAAGATARSQEVRPSRSFRTRDSPPQVSCAHTR
jgi:hypothetical protein